jgi:hypothetical protein
MILVIINNKLIMEYNYNIQKCKKILILKNMCQIETNIYDFHILNIYIWYIFFAILKI